MRVLVVVLLMLTAVAQPLAGKSHEDERVFDASVADTWSAASRITAREMTVTASDQERGVIDAYDRRLAGARVEVAITVERVAEQQTRVKVQAKGAGILTPAKGSVDKILDGVAGVLAGKPLT